MIRGVVIGQEHVVPFLRSIYPRTQAMLVDSVKRMAVKLARKVKEEKLSGQVLKNRTGTLRRSINYRVETTDTSVTGIVGSNKEYAAAHEYGFTGDVQVKEYSRRNRAHMQRDTYWRRTKSGELKKYDRKNSKNYKGGPGEIIVHPHSRHMNIPARPFLRSSLDEMTPEIRAKIEEALRKAIKG